MTHCVELIRNPGQGLIKPNIIKFKLKSINYLNSANSSLNQVLRTKLLGKHDYIYVYIYILAIHQTIF